MNICDKLNDFFHSNYAIIWYNKVVSKLNYFSMHRMIVWYKLGLGTQYCPVKLRLYGIGMQNRIY